MQTVALLPAFACGGGAALAAGKIAFVIHGGAGRLDPAAIERFGEAAYRDALRQSIEAGHAILKRGGSSMDAVEAAVVILEDSPLFNAGKGAVMNSVGANELDASIMDGTTLQAGAVGGVKTVKNPIRAARAVMEKTPHVLLTGEGADQFARESGLEIVSPDYFRTEHRWNEWQKMKNQPPAVKPADKKGAAIASDEFYSTVGAVALDQSGRIAAATSTGGMTNKRYARVGDSPIIGAGTYADSRFGGISCTGHGEFFIRHVVAHEIIARVRHGKLPLAEAARQVVHEELKNAGGGGGVIGLDPEGRIVAEFNTPGMFRAWVDTEGKVEVLIGK
jgi:beta-aspartyl-peptidase (threonine type)